MVALHRQIRAGIEHCRHDLDVRMLKASPTQAAHIQTLTDSLDLLQQVADILLETIQRGAEVDL